MMIDQLADNTHLVRDGKKVENESDTVPDGEFRC